MALNAGTLDAALTEVFKTLSPKAKKERRGWRKAIRSTFQRAKRSGKPVWMDGLMDRSKPASAAAVACVIAELLTRGVMHEEVFVREGKKITGGPYSSDKITKLNVDPAKIWFRCSFTQPQP
ncbi:MAG: hypothetical protein SFW62_01875 [Alphaproteobacteria bacterium]|nr:hypothetical protein [Alphaproteobacteria bacterium]